MVSQSGSGATNANARQCRYTASLTIQNVLSSEPKNEGEVKPEPLVPHTWAYPFIELSPEYCFVVVEKGTRGGKGSWLYCVRAGHCGVCGKAG